MKISIALAQAKAKIKDEGYWYQGSRMDSAGKLFRPPFNPPKGSDGTDCFCALTALGTLDSEFHDAKAIFCEANNIRDITFSISDWNDALDRTFDDVLAAFDRAVELARSRGE